MVRKKLYRIVLVVFILTFIISITNTLYADKQLVVDLAGLFTAEETVKLQQDTKSLSDQFLMDIVIVTTSDTGGKSSREYADDYFDYNGYGVGEERDGILLLLDFDNREAYISTSGNGIRYLTDARIESVLDAIFRGGLTDGNNYGAANAFLEATKGFLDKGIPQGQYNAPDTSVSVNTLTLADMVLGAAVSVISSLGFYFIIKGGYKGRPGRSTFDFRQNSQVHLGVTNDSLINTFVTTRVIPKVNTSSGSSSGKSTVHRSSSGRSHGGGGRKF